VVQTFSRSARRQGFPFANILPRTVLLRDHLTRGVALPISRDRLPRAKFSQPFRLEKDLFEQWNANQKILPLMAEGHIQFSQGQRPWYGITHHNSFDQQLLLRVKRLYRTKPE
jgi:hypothetical protein